MLTLAKEVATALQRREAVAMATVVSVPATGTDAGRVPLGAKLLIFANGRCFQTLGTTNLDAAVVRRALAALEDGEPVLLELLPNGLPASRHSKEAVRVLIEPLLPPDRLAIIGAGHIAIPLHEVGKLLGFEVIVLDDRADYATQERFPRADQVICAPFSAVQDYIPIDKTTYVVLVTRGHQHDEEVLRRVISSPSPYIGMIGSKRRVITVLRRLAQEGVALEQLQHVYAPIGLDIGARTPQEIAIAVAAEMVSVKRGGKGNHLALRDFPRVLQAAGVE